MRFERGKKEAKDVLRIGQRANPIKVSGLFFPPTGALDEVRDVDAPILIIQYKIDEESAHSIFKNIEDGHVAPELEDAILDGYYVSVWGEPKSQGSATPFSVSLSTLHFKTFRELENPFIEFQQKVYLIQLKG